MAWRRAARARPAVIRLHGHALLATETRRPCGRRRFRRTGRLMNLQRGDVLKARFPHASGGRGKKRPVGPGRRSHNQRLRHAVVAQLINCSPGPFRFLALLRSRQMHSALPLHVVTVGCSSMGFKPSSNPEGRFPSYHGCHQADSQGISCGGPRKMSPGLKSRDTSPVSAAGIRSDSIRWLAEMHIEICGLRIGIRTNAPAGESPEPLLPGWCCAGTGRRKQSAGARD